jgi:Uma2 family endonuclease
MAPPPGQRFSFREYLELEEVAGVKHEYLAGNAWAMAGGSPEHTAIAASIIAILSARLRDRPCRVFTADLRIRVRATGLATYPDVTVVCGQLEKDPEDSRGNTVINPKVLVEVLSPSTEDYDRGEKLAHYKRIDALPEVVLVAHDEPRLEVWRRQGDHWTLEVHRGEQTARLESLDVELPLVDVFRDPLTAR